MHVVNKAAVKTAKSMGATRRHKCIDFRYHYLHNIVQKIEMKIERIPTTAKYADVFTKPLKATLYKKNQNNLQILPTTASASQHSCQGECGSL